jgi:type IV pilus assembly protein PilE
MQTSCGPKTLRGVTLVELIVVISIVAILSMMTYPSYLRQIQKSQRISAKTALLDLASREAKFYSTNNAYTASMTVLGYGSAGPIPIPDATSNFYNLSVTLVTGGFTATATPVGRQSTDICGAMTVNHLGIKGANANTCW